MIDVLGGSARLVAPVGRLHYRGADISVRDGRPGPVATRLYEALTAVQYGRSADPYGWTSTIEVPRGSAVARSVSQ